MRKIINILSLVVLNILVISLPFWRLDLSRDKVHSISKISKEIVKNLNDIVNIKVYMTADLPPEVKPLANDMKAMLDEFGKYNSRLKISYIDPSASTELKNEAENLGIQPLQFSRINADKFEMSTGYFGLAMIYGEKKEVLPVAGDVGNLEYFLVSSLKKITSKSLPEIALWQPAGTAAETQLLRQFLERSYKIDDIGEGELKLPQSANTLVIVGQENKIDDKSVETLREWVKSGKGLVVLIDRIVVEDNLKGRKIESTGLDTLLKEYGVEIEPKLVADESSSIASFRSQNGAFMTQYPYWVAIRPENMNLTLPVFSGVSTIVLPWASPLKLSGEAKSLASSTEKVAIDDSLTNLSPAKNDFKSNNGDKVILAAINTSNNVKVAVVSDSDFIKDQYIANNQANLLFGLNLVDYFSQETELMKIRSKNLDYSTMVNPTEGAKTMVRVVNLVIPIVLIVIWWLIVYLKRKKFNNQKYENS